MKLWCVKKEMVPKLESGHACIHHLCNGIHKNITGYILWYGPSNTQHSTQLLQPNNMNEFTNIQANTMTEGSTCVQHVS